MTTAAGVDGGATSVRAVLVDADGRELGRADTPGAALSRANHLDVASAVATAVRAAAEGAGTGLPADTLWAGLAGAGDPVARDSIGAALKDARLASTVVVGTDVEAAHFDAFDDEPGILVVAGTGSIAWGRSESGETARVGGWGQAVGDEGSGFALGVGALRAVARAEDGRAAPTSLSEAVLASRSLTSAREVVEWAGGATKREIAALAPLVVAAADGGDDAARALVELAVTELQGHVAVLVERLGPWSREPRVALAGGLLVEGGMRRELILALAALPVALARVVVDGPRGAAKLALEASK